MDRHAGLHDHGCGSNTRSRNVVSLPLNPVPARLSRRAFSRKACALPIAVSSAIGLGSPSLRQGGGGQPLLLALGAFVHGAPQDPAALDRFTEQIGRGLAIVSWFEAWGSSTAVTGDVIRLELLKHVTDRGAIPMITWEPWDPAAGIDQPAYQLACIARGDFDAYVDSWAYRLAAYGGPVLLRFAHEMNAPWYPWGIGVNDHTAADYVAAWRHVRERFREAGATNVAWVWCIDATTVGDPPLGELYPGDDAVEWLAMDGYNWGTSFATTTWRPLVEVFGDAYEQVSALGARPMMIAEIASTEGGGNKARWISEGFALLPERFPRIEVVCWFNEKQDVADWRVESSPASLAAFTEAVGQPIWAGHPLAP